MKILTIALTLFGISFGATSAHAVGEPPIVFTVIGTVKEVKFVDATPQNQGGPFEDDNRNAPHFLVTLKIKKIVDDNTPDWYRSTDPTYTRFIPKIGDYATFAYLATSNKHGVSVGTTIRVQSDASGYISKIQTEFPISGLSSIIDWISSYRWYVIIAILFIGAFVIHRYIFVPRQIRHMHQTNTDQATPTNT